MPWLLTPAFAAAIDLGVGPYRAPNAYDEQIEGLRATVRVAPAPRVGLELAASARAPGDGISELTETLLLIAYDSNPSTTFQIPIRRELGAASLSAQLSPWARPGEGLRAWPYGVAGAEVALVREDIATVNEDAVATGEPLASVREGELAPRFGVVLGVGYDLWLGEHVGARIQAMQRYGLVEEPDYGNQLPSGEPVPLEQEIATSPMLTVALLVTL